MDIRLTTNIHISSILPPILDWSYFQLFLTYSTCVKDVISVVDPSTSQMLQSKSHRYSLDSVERQPRIQGTFIFCLGLGLSHESVKSPVFDESLAGWLWDLKIKHEFGNDQWPFRHENIIKKYDCQNVYGWFLDLGRKKGRMQNNDDFGGSRCPVVHPAGDLPSTSCDPQVGPLSWVESPVDGW